MRFHFILSFLITAVLLQMPSHARAEGMVMDTANSPVVYQKPCRIDRSVDACAIVHKVIDPQKIKSINMSMVAAKPLTGKAETISVIYLIKAPIHNPGGSLTVSYNGEHIRQRITSTSPSAWYVTSYYSGSDWGKLMFVQDGKF